MSVNVIHEINYTPCMSVNVINEITYTPCVSVNVINEVTFTPCMSVNLLYSAMLPLHHLSRTNYDVNTVFVNIGFRSGINQDGTQQCMISGLYMTPHQALDESLQSVTDLLLRHERGIVQ